MNLSLHWKCLLKHKVKDISVCQNAYVHVHVPFFIILLLFPPLLPMFSLYFCIILFFLFHLFLVFLFLLLFVFLFLLSSLLSLFLVSSLFSCLVLLSLNTYNSLLQSLAKTEMKGQWEKAKVSTFVTWYSLSF